MKKAYRHLFFDLDHTLWDFDRNSDQTILELYAHYQLDKHTGVDAPTYLKKYRATNDALWALYRAGKMDKATLRHERFRRSLGHYGFEDNLVVEQFEKEYIATAPQKTALMEGSLEILQHLHQRYQLHIITNGFQETQHIKLQHSGLAPFFDLILTSDELQINKPAAGIFVEAMKRSGATRKDSLMIGDNLVADVIGARSVGMDQVYYNPAGRSHQEKVTFEIRRLRELRDFL